MLRLTLCFLAIALLFIVNLFVVGGCVDSSSSVKRLTSTPEHAVSLNPSLSDDGRMIVFESSADLSGAGDSAFQAFRMDLSAEAPAFTAIARTRAVAPALSRDGKIIVFASTEDLVGSNADRNSEIFLFDGSRLKQLTQTAPTSVESRLSDGNLQPSLTADGRTVAFSSNRNFTGQNADHSQEIFLYDTLGQTFTQLTNGTNEDSAANPKISRDGAVVYYKLTALTNPDSADLMLVNVATLTTRVVAADVPGLSLTEGCALSNDGTRLVYSAQTGPNETQVFLYDGRDDSIRQLTELGSRVTDVKLQPAISGDGKRIAFATRRRVTSTSDGSVELYLLDLPTGHVQQITNAPAAATAEVTVSLNFDGTLAAFSFPRVLSESVENDDFRNNSEIYLASIAARPQFGAATVVNAAAHGHEPAQPAHIAGGSIASISGAALAFRNEAAAFAGSDPPFTVAGTTVKVNGQPARIFYASPEEVVFVVPNGLSNGPAEFVVTNSDGFSSKAEANISAAAPGVFTISGDGRGEAISLNSDTLMPSPFDPANGKLRVSLFATGVAGAKKVSVTIRGRPAIVETVAASRLSGLDEIHVLLPMELSGAGRSTLIVTADGVQSNPVSIVIAGVAPTPTPTPTPTATPTPSPTPSPASSPAPSPDSSPRIVISQIFGGGGNSGAPFRMTSLKSSTEVTRQLISPAGRYNTRARQRPRGP